jgi:hypothetical protein
MSITHLFETNDVGVTDLRMNVHLALDVLVDLHARSAYDVQLM